MQTSAKIVADSISRAGDRLTTFEVCFHRYVLAEFNTHRVFSRNSASSRAIPIRRQLEWVRASPAWPVEWPAEQAGMQGGEALEPELEEEARGLWADAVDDAILFAERLKEVGLHKSVVNRLLEPFMWHTVIVTATAWQNFFDLRANKMAQPEIRIVAEMMKDCYDKSEPKLLAENMWHTPYIQPEESRDLTVGDTLKVSAARCARVSYLTHDGVRDISADLDLYERLVSARHSSPLEHVATPNPDNKHDVIVDKAPSLLVLTLPRYGNLRGWHALRFDVESEQDYQAFS